MALSLPLPSGGSLVLSHVLEKHSGNFSGALSCGVCSESMGQCKEIEENNRMGKTRDLFKKIRDAKGTFHAKMGTIKD